MNILVFNVGSTTLKYAGFDMNSGEKLTGGLIDRIGQDGGDAADHLSAARQVLESLGILKSDGRPAYQAIAHRVVQGGDAFHEPTLVDDVVLQKLETLDSLAPLHNPPARAVINAIAKLNVGLPQVLVFDTAYYSTLAPVAYRYAIPDQIYQDYRVRRYGFHGTSHQYVTGRAIEWLRGQSVGTDSLKILSLHLGGGASVTASVDGVAVDTSMGMTPLEGLVMATRCGDLDPSIPLHLMRVAGMSVDQVDHLLNKQSGLVGLCGEGDMRSILRRRDEGDQAAELAIDLYVRRIQKTIGGMIAVLGGLDALIFTAGVGENSAAIRQAIVEPLAHFGIALDDMANAAGAGGASIRDIGDASAKVRILIVPTNEELAIATQTRSRLEAE